MELTYRSHISIATELNGGTEIETDVSNQCARLTANAIIYYNSAILSRLLTMYEASGNINALALITQISPWEADRFGCHHGRLDLG